MNREALQQTCIPSGENSVWADVSPLLDAACKGFIFLFSVHLITLTAVLIIRSAILYGGLGLYVLFLH